VVAVTKAGLRALARAAEAARHPTELGQPGPPAMDPVPVVYAFNAQGFKFYSIPGSAAEAWNPEVHGKPMHEDDVGGEYTDIMWRPSEYRISTCSCEEYMLHVPGEVAVSEADVDVLRGLHALLSIARPDM
jgi:hypothetical protein